MTEINDNTEENSIHWAGFTTGLIGAPLILSTALVGPLFILDVFYDSADIRSAISVLGVLITIGATLYALIGTPVLIYHLKRHHAEVGRIMALSILSVLAMLPVGAFFSLVMFDPAALMIAGISTCFGLLGAPVLAALFTFIYQRFTRT
ncbi:hypothetical protein [uncultured Sulfitobacter sp.]|uniref:hypothetical protein n=1 Tax=uncultured Sulfitobacter sp. TaxID=191468 RepID=UPI0026138235|nr:hypothetical protein [uncultured Sulfitobacter sp.]